MYAATAATNRRIEAAQSAAPKVAIYIYKECFALTGPIETDTGNTCKQNQEGGCAIRVVCV
jgi:hypothetical protein